MKNLAFLSALLLLIMISRNAFSQSGNEQIRLHIAPLNLFDPVSGVLQVGIQKNFNQRIALSLDHGIRMRVYEHVRDSHERKEYKYSKSKIELKYYTFLKEKDSLSPVFSYISVESMYFPQNYVKENGLIYRAGKDFSYDYSDIKRRVWVSSFKLGVERRYRKVVLDFYFGIGIRRMSINHQTSGEVEGSYLVPKDIHFPPIDQNEGVFYRPHIALGFKAGYIIR